MNQLIKPYKGYFIFLRAIMLMFQSESLNAVHLGIFIAIASECDWDSKHPTTYGYLTKTDEYLSKKWGRDKATVWRWKQVLMKLNCLSKTSEGDYKLNYVEWFRPDVAQKLASKNFASIQELIAETQRIIADSQDNIADVQQPQDQNSPQSSKVSFKGDLSLSDVNEVLSESDYDDIDKWISERGNN